MIFNFFNKNSNKKNERKRQESINDLKSYSWDETEKVISLIEPQILVFDDKSKAKIGQSKFGGTPDLPDEIKWPEFENKPMIFYSQLNLSEISEFHKDIELPKKGIIYFFSYFKNPVNQFGAEYKFRMNKKEYKVLFFDGKIHELNPTKFPKNLISDYHFKESTMNFELDFRLPASIYTWKYEEAKLTESDAQTYEEVIEEFDDYCQPDMILGTPCPVQDPVEFDWSYSYLDTEYSNDSNTQKEVNKLRPDFINLLSFTMWGRFDKIGISNCYFGIRKEDLENKKFDKTVFVMQDT